MVPGGTRDLVPGLGTRYQLTIREQEGKDADIFGGTIIQAYGLSTACCVPSNRYPWKVGNRDI